jgi:tRNA (guanine37-N1)-methyltransferase
MKSAESVRKKLAERKLLDTRYGVQREKGHVYFPVRGAVAGFEIVEMDARKRERKPRSLKDALGNALSDEELENALSSFDVMGDIAVIEIPRNLEAKEKTIGEAILKVHRNVKTVCKKAGRHTGVYRTMPVEAIAGKPKTSTIYTEHGVKMRVDVGEVYFSPRLATERKRIANQVKDGETIAALFAGVGPFPLVIAKEKKVHIYAVELNPRAYELMLENIKMNKLKGVIEPVLGDVREIRLQKCDRVLMPLPKGGEDFLDVAFRTCKKGGIIHFYQFASEEDLYSDAIAKVKEHGKVEILDKRKVKPHAPRVWQVVLDFRRY